MSYSMSINYIINFNKRLKAFRSSVKISLTVEAYPKINLLFTCSKNLCALIQHFPSKGDVLMLLKYSNDFMTTVSRHESISVKYSSRCTLWIKFVASISKYQLVKHKGLKKTSISFESVCVD